jgi:hypothetical protein
VRGAYLEKENELAEELAMGAKKTRASNVQGRQTSEQSARSALLTKLKEKIKNYDLLKNGNADLKKVTAGNKKLLGEAKETTDEYRTGKVIRAKQ